MNRIRTVVTIVLLALFGTSLSAQNGYKVTRFAAAFQSGSFSPRKAWNTVPDVYMV